MEVLNQLLSSQADYLNALRHAQQLPTALSLDSGNNPKSKINANFLIRLFTAAGILYLGYQIYKYQINDLSKNED